MNCRPETLGKVLTGELLYKVINICFFRPVGVSKITESALPYTERHFKRLTQMMQDLHFLSYTVNCMQPHVRNVDINIGE